MEHPCPPGTAAARQPNPRSHPLVCIQILSEGDTLNSTRPRLIDYSNFGPKTLWIFNPETRQAYAWTPTSLEPASDTLSVPGTPITLHLPTLYAMLD